MKQPNDKNSRYCTRCTRALKACLCEYIVPLENRTPLYILQHPYEVAHPKGTAALLAASLQQAEIRVGEDFSGDTWLNDLLADPSLRCYLLWPDEEAISPVELRQQMESVSSGATSVAFILLDGTWRKAFRMLQSNPALARLPRIGLGAIAGQYAIRKKPFPEALSTIEAGYHLLSQWEGEPERYAPLLTLFERLNTQWQAFAEGRRT
ncbi:DTW domain-containing protein [Aeromonas jandaei]|uniref:tRNA-uridine aminocarboxypropyltransferase n=2 Tax=Aeromonas TaxID=642 RepID=A0A7T4A9G7_AERJA|nr:MULTISPECIES: tRNA-uridine aminocarboxypropyltransferase [Aeromonas]PTT45637.1 DTW domain-containing protein [Aeromonas sp. HMWF016]QQB19727.1 DTW domain-containing protein [Aeromonas jandaei]UCA34406.1 DTW domain-containing protein [Aeromonas jandaei]